MTDRVILLEPMPGHEMYRLDCDYHFTAFGELWTIERGFMYDGASVPRGAWYSTHSPFHPRVMRAALEHDYFCVTRPPKPDAKQAADRFLEVLAEDGVSPWRRTLMHRAVRWFGPRW